MRRKGSMASGYEWPRGGNRDVGLGGKSDIPAWVGSSNSSREFQSSASIRRRRRWVHSAAMRVSTSASWLGPVGWNSRRNAAVRASSAAGFSPGMMWDAAWMPDFRALREEAALPSGEVGPVDFWEFSRLALICAWDVMIVEPRGGSGAAERMPVLLSAKLISALFSEAGHKRSQIG